VKQSLFSTRIGEAFGETAEWNSMDDTFGTSRAFGGRERVEAAQG